MNYKVALRRIHAELVEEKSAEKSTTLFIRVKEPGGEMWCDSFVALLLGAQDKKEHFTIDMSKWFYVDKGNVKYLWRVVVRGTDVPAGLAFFSHCVLGVANANTKELDKFPLSEGSNTPSTQQTAR